MRKRATNTGTHLGLQLFVALLVARGKDMVFVWLRTHCFEPGASGVRRSDTREMPVCVWVRENELGWADADEGAWLS